MLQLIVSLPVPSHDRHKHHLKREQDGDEYRLRFAASASLSSPFDKMTDNVLQSCIDRFSKQFGGPNPFSRPTDRSIAQIQRELGFSIPEDFVDFARRCAVYASWFTSIGEDFSNPVHILSINRQYRTAEYGSLPKDLVVINHGYDGDLTCYDLSKTNAEGRLSICYCWVSESSNPVFEDERQHLAYSICDYLIPNLDFWEKNGLKK